MRLIVSRGFKYPQIRLLLWIICLEKDKSEEFARIRQHLDSLSKVLLLSTWVYFSEETLLWPPGRNQWLLGIWCSFREEGCRASNIHWFEKRSVSSQPLWNKGNAVGLGLMLVDWQVVWKCFLPLICSDAIIINVQCQILLSIGQPLVIHNENKY